MTSLRFIDCHCHLNDPAFSHDIDEVIHRAKERGVVAVVDCSLTSQDAERSLELLGKYPHFVIWSIGFDPALEDDDEFARVVRLIRRYKSSIVAIGEVGLDYYRTRDRKARHIQEERFRSFIELARELGLPLVIHSRSATPRAVEVVLEMRPPHVLFHAFDGKPSRAEAAAEAGYLFSIPPSVVRSEQKQRLVDALPLESLVLESDAPVLGPVRGERNEPANVFISARKIADIKAITVEEVASVTTATAAAFFQFAQARSRS